MSHAPRFSIRWLMAGVALLAVCFAGLSYRTVWWQYGIVSFRLAACAFAGLTAAYRTGADRAFCRGFAWCGLGYTFVSTAFLLTGVHYSLISTNLIGAIWLSLDVKHPIPSSTYYLSNLNYGEPVALALEGPSYFKDRSPDIKLYLSSLRAFFNIAQSLWAWLFALLGGWRCAIYWRKGEALKRRGTP